MAGSPVFNWLARTGNVANDEMLRVFNCGVGMVLVTPKPDEVLASLKDMGETATLIGHIAKAAESTAKAGLRMKACPDFHAA